MPTAVQIGAGKIGRGFLGHLLQDGGYQTIFLDTDTELVERLNTRRSYPLRLVTESTSETHTIDNFEAIHAHDKAALDALVGADLICTAVGVANFPQVAAQLAQGLNARAEAGGSPVDVLLCENQWHAASLMRELIAPHVALPAGDYFRRHVGLVETVIGIMVPAPTDETRAENPLLIVTEPFEELPVAEPMRRGPVPTLPGLVRADNIEAYEARKLYLHNMSHAALAYLGYRRGYQYIWQCVADEKIVGICRDALTNTAAAISDWYDLPAPELEEYGADLMRRFANKALGDTVARVAADPLRKLRPTDRLIGAAEMCVSMGLSVEALAKIIAAALCYDNPADPDAVELQTRRRRDSGEAVLQALCGIRATEELSYWVRGALQQSSTTERQHVHAPE